MAKKKDSGKPHLLSQEYVKDSSDENTTNRQPSKKSKIAGTVKTKKETSKSKLSSKESNGSASRAIAVTAKESDDDYGKVDGRKSRREEGRNSRMEMEDDEQEDSSKDDDSDIGYSVSDSGKPKRRLEKSTIHHSRASTTTTNGKAEPRDDESSVEDSDEDEEESDGASRSAGSDKQPRTLNHRTDQAQHSNATGSKEVESSAGEEEEELSDVESENGRGSSDFSPSNTTAQKRRSDQADIRDGRTVKKSKIQARPAPAAIPAKPFHPPRGFETFTSTASDYLSNFDTSMSGIEDKQLWYFTAPSNVSVDSLRDLDMDAALAGAPILEQGGQKYSLRVEDLSNELLLLVPGGEGTFKRHDQHFTQMFHLRALPEALETGYANSRGMKHNFFATTPGEAPLPREQPEGLRMRYQPYGSGAFHKKTDQQTEKVEFRNPDPVPESAWSQESKPEEKMKRPKKKRKQTENGEGNGGGGAAPPSSKENWSPKPEDTSMSPEPTPIQDGERKKKEKKKKKKSVLEDEVRVDA